MSRVSIVFCGVRLTSCFEFSDAVPKLLLQVADSAVIALLVDVASFYGGQLNPLWGAAKGKESK